MYTKAFEYRLLGFIHTMKIFQTHDSILIVKLDTSLKGINISIYPFWLYAIPDLLSTNHLHLKLIYPQAWRDEASSHYLRYATEVTWRASHQLRHKSKPYGQNSLEAIHLEKYVTPQLIITTRISDWNFIIDD